MTSVDRRRFLELTAIGAGALATGSVGCADALESGLPAQTPTERRIAPFELDESTVLDLGRALASRRWTSKALVERYLERIRDLDGRGPMLRAILEVNPDAFAIAEELDRERAAGKVRGPLHGVPIVIKDNIDTADRMHTTAGSLALVGARPERDAFLVTKLRAAGAVIIAKTNLSEWANIRSSRSSSGWSARGGQCRNPYVLDRNPSGSSSGTAAAVAANLAAIGIGTETDGSIVSPANNCGLVGIKPTIGLVSRSGIIPIAHSQDTAGPMTRTVADAAIVLSIIAGADPRDPPTLAGKPADYVGALDPGGLRGARVGIARKFAGFHPEVDLLLEAAIAAMKHLGATVVDPADLPTHGKLDDPELVVLLYELKADLNRYLAGLGPSAPVRSLEEVIAFNERHADREMPYFGQELFIQAQAKGPLSSEEYRAALATCQRLSRTEGLDAVFARHRLDAFIAPTGGPAWPTDLVNGDHITGGSSTPAAVAGYPSITVPMGFVHGLPVGLSFTGLPFTEATLLKLAYAFEQASRARRPPRFWDTLA